MIGEANPDDVDAYRRLGNLYVIAGNNRDARAAFSELIRINPDDEEAKKRLEEIEVNGDADHQTVQSK